MAETILETAHLSKTYEGAGRSTTVLKDVNFSVETGATMAIVGPSGSGKSTLLGLCAGLDRSSEGTVHLNNILLNNLSEDELARIRNQYVGFIFQNFQLLPTLTALENVMVPLELRGEKNIRSRALALLDKVGLKERVQHYPSQLSGGEQQMLAVARILRTGANLLLLDEISEGLAPVIVQALGRMIKMLKAKGYTIVMVEQNFRFAAPLADRFYVVEHGQIVEHIDAAELQSKQSVLTELLGV